MNGQNAFMKSSVGFTRRRAVVSALCKGDRLWRELAERDVQRRNQRKRDRHGNAVRRRFSNGDGQGTEKWLKHHGDGRLADPPETEAGHRNAELGGGDVACWLADRTAHGSRAAGSLGDQLIDARLADGDDREFGRDEKSVREDEREDARQAPEDPSQRYAP